MKRRGISLMELIVALLMSVFLIMAATSAFSSAITFEKQNTSYLEANETRLNFEQKIRNLLIGSYVSPTATDSMTYFLGQASGSTAESNVADNLTFTSLSFGMNDNEL